MLVILDAQQAPWDERQAARGKNVVQLKKMTTVQEELRIDEGASRSRSQLFAGAARLSSGLMVIRGNKQACVPLVQYGKHSGADRKSVV